MIDVRCKTRLDLSQHEDWPTKLPALPRVGDLIQSAHEWPGGTHIELVISAVKWVKDGKNWLAELELAIPRRWDSQEAFYGCYRRLQPLEV